MQLVVWELLSSFVASVWLQNLRKQNKYRDRLSVKMYNSMVESIALILMEHLRLNIYQSSLCHGIVYIEVLSFCFIFILFNADFIIKDSLLNVRLAFVSPSISGTYWMRLNMTNKPVKFQLIYRMNDTNQLLAIVRPYGYKLPKSMGTLNETLVRNGLASLNQSDNVLVSTKKQSRLLASLESCQTKAMKDGSGMWSINHKETLLESTKRMFDNMLNKLKSSRQ